MSVIFIREIRNKTRSKRAKAILKLRKRRKERKALWGQVVQLTAANFSSGYIGLWQGVSWVSTKYVWRRKRDPRNGQHYYLTNSRGERKELL